ncbi:NAD-dependent epimerase/dehydratase family protein [Bradyrhizobium sp.]|uniref:NAD-dependent epimerase/dehydratase family protein n=1 Tax=Bradyrhizobium sp. TaxID=376 RepID=UPI002393ED2F|nr:NAD-dependent epimerase/dehydratase family protein [Bradyrhizobium sp.]MDE2376695.1 NAD-dependent epimerase/dehydratase family protein [Bradyrhizobium sp.]
MVDQKSCIVLGASSQPASWLVPALLQDGWFVHLVSRGIKPQLNYGANAVWHSLDLRDEAAQIPAIGARVTFDTLGMRSTCLESLHVAGLERVIRFSSTSILTKIDSSDPVDAKGAADVANSELAFIATCDRLRIAWTVLRPTLIYGGKFGDRTVQDVARIIRLLGFFPVFGDASGLRQPVHAEDLAHACLQICRNEKTFGRIYNVVGGEMLSYRDMISRIFQAMGKTPRFLTVPLPAFELAARIIRLHPRYRHIRSSMAERMQKDLIFSDDDARLDFGYAPRRFEPLLRASLSAGNAS